jgi:hypothetical protein
VKIKNRKLSLHIVDVVIGSGYFRPILVTPSQLAKLNHLPGGKEIFLTNYYCYRGGEFSVIRTPNGLQYIPSPYRADANDA